jgi:hypothetical protein
MPSRFDLPTGPESESEPSATPTGIDGSKRYDIYCTQYGSPLVVYRNVLIKRMTPLLAKGDSLARIGDFVELESADGRCFFVSRMSLIALCEHGMPFPGELVSLKSA